MGELPQSDLVVLDHIRRRRGVGTQIRQLSVSNHFPVWLASFSINFPFFFLFGEYDSSMEAVGGVRDEIGVRAVPL